MKKQEQLFSETVQGYEKDRVIREQEFDLKKADFQEKIQELTHRLKTQQDSNYKLSKEYFDYKHEIHKTKQRLQDNYELAKVEN